MNILFLTLGNIQSLEERSLYTDLIRKFVEKGHHVYAFSPTQRREKQIGGFVDTGNDYFKLYKLKTLNITKTSIVEKAVSTLTIEPLLKFALKNKTRDIKFDLVLYATPPITFEKAVRYIKKRDGAVSFLMLKDIFPQNAVDLGMLSLKGFKSIVYKYFRKKEKQLYGTSDYIGCMSPANVKYLLRENEEIDCSKVGLCYNSAEREVYTADIIRRNEIRSELGIPYNDRVFVYGGNLGKPQGITFLLNCLDFYRNMKGVFFLIVGDGTDFERIMSYIKHNPANNILLLKTVKRETYNRILTACDVGMVFLNHSFTIPNFPSRTLTYMQAGLPIFACTDTSSDIGTIIEDGEFGWWCESDNVEMFKKIMNKILEEDLTPKGKAAMRFFLDNYTTDCTYDQIVHLAKL